MTLSLSEDSNRVAKCFSNLATKTLEQCPWIDFSTFIVAFEQLFPQWKDF